MNLERLRKSTRLSQEEFWGRVGITQSGGSRYEAGREVPEPVRLLLTIAYGSKREREMVLRALIGSERPAGPAGEGPAASRTGATSASGRPAQA